MKSPVYRVIDANFNRSREGLRVCEEFARFFLNDRLLTKELKQMRSQISRIYNLMFKDKKPLFAARDISGDTGRRPFLFEKKRSVPAEVLWANFQRSKESLRVLEEFSKLANVDASDKFRKMRFKLYEIEGKAFKKCCKR